MRTKIVYMRMTFDVAEKKARREGLVYFITLANVQVEIISTLGARRSSVGRHRFTPRQRKLDW